MQSSFKANFTASVVTQELAGRAPCDYDCVVGNIASLLVAHEIDPDTVLGGVFSLSPNARGEDSPYFDNIGSTQIAGARKTTSLRVSESRASSDSTCKSETRVAIGDGYDMPWSPYHRKHHVEHGFLIVSDLVAFDAYNTVTEFGDATPQILEDEWRSVPIDRNLDIYIDTTDEETMWLAEPATSYDPLAVSQYRNAIDLCTISVEQLAIDTWSLARARRVNHRYALATELPVADRLPESVSAWTSASESVYMALRRLRRGRSVPNSFVGAIHAALDTDEALIGAWLR